MKTIKQKVNLNSKKFGRRCDDCECVFHFATKDMFKKKYFGRVDAEKS